MKICPYCAEEIQEQAIVCRFCKRDLVARRVRRAPRAPHPRDWISRTASFGCGTLLALMTLGAVIAGVRGLVWP